MYLCKPPFAISEPYVRVLAPKAQKAMPQLGHIFLVSVRHVLRTKYSVLRTE